jgi:hypothetical protein
LRVAAEAERRDHQNRQREQPGIAEHAREPAFRRTVKVVDHRSVHGQAAILVLASGARTHKVFGQSAPNPKHIVRPVQRRLSRRHCQGGD